MMCSTTKKRATPANLVHALPGRSIALDCCYSSQTLSDRNSPYKERRGKKESKGSSPYISNVRLPHSAAM
eukprot:scaffold246355_cov31-Tisochrysis_lutea.AAC.1